MKDNTYSKNAPWKKKKGLHQTKFQNNAMCSVVQRDRLGKNVRVPIFCWKRLKMCLTGRTHQHQYSSTHRGMNESSGQSRRRQECCELLVSTGSVQLLTCSQTHLWSRCKKNQFHLHSACFWVFYIRLLVFSDWTKKKNTHTHTITMRTTEVTM